MDIQAGPSQRHPYTAPSDDSLNSAHVRERTASPAAPAVRPPMATAPSDHFEAAPIPAGGPAAPLAPTDIAAPHRDGDAPPRDPAWYVLATLGTLHVLTTVVLFLPKLIVHGVTACYEAVRNYFDPQLVMTEADIELSARHTSAREKRANYERYLGAMLMPNVWGGELEIAAFADMAHTPFDMYDLLEVNSPVFLRKMALNAGSHADDAPRLSLVRMGEHYQVVRHARPTGQRTDFADATFINMPGDGTCLFYALAYLSDHPGARAQIDAYAQARAMAESGRVPVPEPLRTIGQDMRESIVNHIATHPDAYMERLDLVVVNALADR
jgi:hypothetical protein